MSLPQQLLDSLRAVKGFDKEAFEKVHESGGQITSIRYNPIKPLREILTAVEQHPVPWSQYGFYLETRPSFTFDPFFHAGCYYVQEASSMFLEQALTQLTDLSKSLKVLDLSAAPGGKSTHIQSLISKESLLVSNEVIKSRANVLKDNMIKWGYSNGIVTNNDPKDIGKLNGYFDVIVVDAPCSGSGLFRRDPDAISEWSLNNVTLCSQRQQRILADIWPALKEGGLLIYSTCSYSKEEDEDIAQWLKRLPIEYCKLKIDPAWGIVESEKGYRFWPDKVKGEGFYMACFRKKGEEDVVEIKGRSKLETVSKKESPIIHQWVDNNRLAFLKHGETVYAWPDFLVNDFNFLLNQLHILYSGTIIGDIVRDKLVPHHALAMSGLAHETLPVSALDYENSILYLKRKELTTGISAKGWQLVSYEGQILGWINVLPNRINNYYPKELRIIKDN